VGRIIVFILIAAVIIGIWARSALAGKRREKEALKEELKENQKENDLPEINKHPERLNQMLDPTDDA
jgi:hypothetical protein